MILHYGVADVPYADILTTHERRNLRWRTKRKPWQSLPGTTTTGDVAEILEARYGIFGHFQDKYGSEIGDMLAEAMEHRLEAVLSGAPISNAPVLPEGSLGAIEQKFRSFLDNREMDGAVPGVPTEAAKRGYNPRLAHPYAKDNPSRPSFIASGNYQAHARVWMTE